MAITPKQQRNGIPEEPAGGATPPGPMPAIPMDEAMAAGNAHANTGHDVWLGGGIGSAVQTDWSAGLAIVEPSSSTVSGSPTTNVPSGDAS